MTVAEHFGKNQRHGAYSGPSPHQTDVKRDTEVCHQMLALPQRVKQTSAAKPARDPERQEPRKLREAGEIKIRHPNPCMWSEWCARDNCCNHRGEDERPKEVHRKVAEHDLRSENGACDGRVTARGQPRRGTARDE